MAAPSYNTRSNSFPSRSNPVASQFDEQLSRLRRSESACCSSSTIHSKLSLLSGLYDCIGELLQRSSSQNAISCQWGERVLEGSIKLLDSCGTISDVLAQMKEKSHRLQSILRRRCSKDETVKEVAEYLRSRKAAVKVVAKTLKELKKGENEEEMASNEVVSKLRECQRATIRVLESVLGAMAGSQSQRSNWESVVSKLMKSKRVVSQEETEIFLVGFEASDAALNPEKVRFGLEKMEVSMKSVEEGLEVLFRHLIKTRTTILNIINC